MWNDKIAWNEHNKRISESGIESLRRKYSKNERTSWLLEGWKKKFDVDGEFRDKVIKNARVNGLKSSPKIKQLWKDENYKKNVSEKNRLNALRQWETMREKMCESMKGGRSPLPEEHKKKISQTMSLIRLAQWQIPEFREKMLKAQNNSYEVKLKRLESLRRRPTTLEKEFMGLIKEYNLPYKYTGDGSFLIGFKNPDFVNINGEKICVEVANRYHHQGDWEERRIEHFSKWGWKCIVVFEDELDMIPSIFGVAST